MRLLTVAYVVPPPRKEGIFTMAEAAATMFEPNQLAHELYGQSLRPIRTIGNLAVKGLVHTPEYIGTWNEAYTDFIRAVAENLATDEQYGERLSFEPLHSFAIADGKVVDKSGLPMIDMVRNGKRSSLKAAQTDSRMLIQAERDEGDEIIAHIVDNLDVNEMYMVVSVEPKEELEQDPDFWHKDMHYIKGMAVVQVYYRASQTEMRSGYYSLKGSDTAVLRRLFAAEGVTISADESPNRFSRYGIRQSVSEQQADAAGPQFVARHRAETGQYTSMISVTDLVADNQQEMRRYFDTYIPKLAEALETKVNNQTMQSLARALLGKTQDMNHDDITMLTRVATSSNFNDNDARFMEEMVRYASIEELRKPLQAIINGQAHINTANNLQTVQFIDNPAAYVTTEHMQLSILNEQLARNVANGRSEGRTYGGCSGAGNVKQNYDDEFTTVPNSQKIWGGATSETTGVDEDKFGPLQFECSKGHANTRPRNKLLDKCKSCHENVRCAPDDKKPQKIVPKTNHKLAKLESVAA